jgi:hypothetical protein
MNSRIIVVAAALFVLGFASASFAADPQPPGFKKGNTDKKWQGQDLPPGLTNDKASRDWQGSPPGWSNQSSQGWQNGPGSMGGGKGKGR